MSDIERSASRSQSFSPERSPLPASPRQSESPEKSPVAKASPASKSRSPSPRSRSRSRRRYHSRSRSHSPRRRSRYSRSRSRSPYGRNGDYGHRSHSRSPMSNRRRHMGNRDYPKTSRCLGIFGLSLYTQERDLKDVFSRYGPIDELQIVYDHQTGRSRGFAFIYFRNEEDAVDAKERAAGVEIDGRRIRVDYSITKRAHTPTPGIYLGKPTGGGGGGGGYKSGYGRRSPSPNYRRGYGSKRYYSRSRSRSRSYSPRRY